MRGLLRHPWVAVAALVVLGVAFLGGGLGALTAADTSEVSENASGVTGYLHLTGGLTDGTKYIVAGEPGYKSQSIVVTGQVEGTDVRSNKICSYQYRVTINGQRWTALDSPTYTTPATAPHKARANLQTHTFTLDGQVTGALRVELHAKLTETSVLARNYGSCDKDATDRRIAYDGAALLDGAGRLSLTAGQSNIFEEGQKVELDVKTGEGRWYIEIVDGTGKTRCDVTVSLGLGSGARTGNAGACSSNKAWDGKYDGRASFTVPAGAFVEGGHNVWRATLRNSYIDHAVEQFVTVDKKIRAPEPPVVSISDKQPNVGDKVTYTMTAGQNPATGKPIGHFLVYIWYGDTTQHPTTGSPAWIANGVKVSAIDLGNLQFTATYDITVKQASRIQSEIYAVDTQGRASGSTLNAADKAALEDSYGRPVNDDSEDHIVPKGADTPAGPQAPKSDSSVAFLLIVALAVLAILVWQFAPLAPSIKLAVIGLGGAFAYWLYAGGIL